MIGGLAKTVLSIALAVSLSAMAILQMSGPGPSQGFEWHISTIDNNAFFLAYQSLELDSFGNPHIAYIGESVVKYAKWNGTAWNIEIADSSVQVGFRGVSLALDSDDNPHVTYHDSWSLDLRYAHRLGTNWSAETVDSEGTSGRWSSIALDKNDSPHISYQGKSNYLKYARWNGTAWNIETVDTWGHNIFTSLALDNSDNPHISYTEEYDADLKYARWNGTAWNIEIVDSGGDVGRCDSLALDNSDNPHISYFDETNDDLKYARWNGTAWNNETVDSSGDVGPSTSIELDSGGNPHISYFDRGNRDLKYAMWNESAWNVETVNSTGDVGMANSIALDKDDGPHIGYLDSTNLDLNYATRTELEPSLRSVSLNINPDTLNLKSKGKWMTAYFTTENADVADIDPSALLLDDRIPCKWWNIQNETTLIVKFDRIAVQAIVPVSESVDLKITGQWKDGQSFEVHDTIRVIHPGR